VFLDRLRTYSVLRFMDWMKTNNSTVKSWSERTPLAYRTWTKDSGAPIEVMIALANQVGAHPWFNIPAQADDAYVQNFAQMVSASLNSKLGVYLEYSNETWNGQFTQCDYAWSQSQLQGIQFPEFLGMRTRAIGQVFKSALGISRVVSVYGAQAGASTWAVSTAMDYLKSRYGTAGIDAVAIAPYFGLTPDPAEAGRYTAMSLDAFIAFVRSDILPGPVAATTKYATVATAYGLHLLAYEGGQHMSGIRGAEGIAELNSLFYAFNRDTRIKQLYLDYLASWKQGRGELFMHYQDVSKFNQWGSWGALEYVGQPRSTAPKFDGIQTFIEQNPVWWTQ